LVGYSYSLCVDGLVCREVYGLWLKLHNSKPGLVRTSGRSTPYKGTTSPIPIEPFILQLLLLLVLLLLLLLLLLLRLLELIHHNRILSFMVCSGADLVIVIVMLPCYQLKYRYYMTGIQSWSLEKHLEY
jgi:hypothetical protein